MKLHLYNFNTSLNLSKSSDARVCIIRGEVSSWLHCWNRLRKSISSSDCSDQKKGELFSIFSIPFQFIRGEIFDCLHSLRRKGSWSLEGGGDDLGTTKQKRALLFLHGNSVVGFPHVNGHWGSAEESQNSWAVCPCTVCLLDFLETSFEFAELAPHWPSLTKQDPVSCVLQSKIQLPGPA